MILATIVLAGKSTRGPAARSASTARPPTPCDVGRTAVRLTPREREVLRLLAHGLTDRGIAATLSLSYRTVTTHVAAILTKLDVPSRTAAAVCAVQRDLVDLP